MARRRKSGRAIDGIVLVHKPGAITSNGVLIKTRAIFNAQKAGHTGALDPLATGLLPICLGEATKFSQFLLDTDKRYTVEAKLGERTNTSDADGEVVQTREVNVSPEQLEQAIATFRGEIEQIPSMFSALKYQGQPLYKYAREGIEVPREARPITIFSADLLRFDGDLIEMDVHCSKGTYIRTLIDDLGELLGCGAHVTKLHRTQVGPFKIDDAVSIEQLNESLDKARAADLPLRDEIDQLLLPMDAGLGVLGKAEINAEQAKLVLNGGAVELAENHGAGQYRIYIEGENSFIGVGEVGADGMLAPKRLVNKS